MLVCANCCLLALPDEGLKKHVSRAGLQSGPSCRWVKAGFDERCSCRNATSNPFLENPRDPRTPPSWKSAKEREIVEPKTNAMQAHPKSSTALLGNQSR